MRVLCLGAHQFTSWNAGTGPGILRGSLAAAQRQTLDRRLPRRYDWTSAARSVGYPERVSTVCLDRRVPTVSRQGLALSEVPMRAPFLLQGGLRRKDSLVRRCLGTILSAWLSPL